MIYRLYTDSVSGPIDEYQSHGVLVQNQLLFPHVEVGRKEPDDAGCGAVRAANTYRKEGHIMPKYVIEREIPGLGKLTQRELAAASQKSCTVLQNLGPRIQWLESYVTDDKLYCIYISPNEEMIQEHARESGFPASRVSVIRAIIDPTTAEG